VAEEAVRALAHWNGSDFADAVFQQLQDVLREDFVKLVQEVRVMRCALGESMSIVLIVCVYLSCLQEMASGASNVVMVLSRWVTVMRY
jgi:hypothetical protein